MKRIDTINARENMFGVGKSGFHDNADLPGQDATYISPEWFNTVQEELCNLLELRGITLDPASKRQLYDLLTTQVDLEALADEIETNFIRKNQIADDLTTSDATKVVSAKQAKKLQDEKLAIANLVNNLTSGGTQTAVTAEAIKLFYQMFSGGSSRLRIPNPLEPDKPWIIQFFNTPSSAANIETNFIQNFPVAFPNSCTFVIASDYQDAFVNINTLGLVLSTYGKTKTGVGIIWDAIMSGSYPTSRSASILAIGN